MSQPPLVSVVMPVFNAERFLSEAIRSIFNQTFRDLELIVVDDGSDDDGPSILARLSKAEPRMRVVRQAHRGLAAALNTGCGLAKGAYLARMDADDVAVANRIEIQVGRLQADPSLGVLGAAVVVVDQWGKRLYSMRYPISDAEIKRVLETDCPFAHPVVIMRREAFERTGGYREGAFEAAEDYDLWLRIAERWRMANLPQELLQYRWHSTQVSTDRIEQQILGTVAAQVAARLRRAGHDAAFANGAHVTLDVLKSQPDYQDLIVEAGGARALFLSVLHRDSEALRVLDWAEGVAGSGRRSSRARARASLARAAALFWRGDVPGAVWRTLAAAHADPEYVLRVIAKASRQFAGSPLAVAAAMAVM